MDDQPELVRNDPESEATFDLLTDVVAEELYARASIGDHMNSLDDAKQFAKLVADAVLDRFVIRERDPDKPRSSWRTP